MRLPLPFPLKQHGLVLILLLLHLTSWTQTTENVMLCQGDTLFVNTHLANHFEREDLFYRWEKRKGSAESWEKIESPNDSYLVMPDISEGFELRNIISTQPDCPADSLCVFAAYYYNIVLVPPHELRFRVTDAHCGQRNGAIELENKPNQPFTFVWNRKWRTADLYNQPAGKYELQASDGWGCTSKWQFDLKNSSPPPLFEIQIQNASCNKSNGSLQLLPQNGQTIQCEWTNGSTALERQALKAGRYEMRITNEYGCSLDTFTTVSEVQFPPTVEISKKDATCNQANGMILAKAKGKGAPYTYVWNGKEGYGDLNGIPQGLYKLTLLDKWGCEYEQEEILVYDYNPVFASFSTIPVSCPDEKDGAILVTVREADNKYAFKWSNGAQSKNIGNLGAGNYELDLKHKQSGCQKTYSITVEENKPLKITAFDIADSAGFTLIVKTDGGSPPYIYALEEGNFQPFSVFEGLPKGKYDLFVQDSLGCTQKAQHEILDTPPQQISEFIYINNYLTPNADGQNDEFEVKAPGMYDAWVEIYSPQGKQVFAEWASIEKWRGSAAKTFCPSGLYYYVVSLSLDGHETQLVKGTVKLVR